MSDNKKSPSIMNFILPSLGQILFIAIFLAAIGLGPRLMNMDGDLGRHLTLGNYILDSKHIPTRDIFSFTKIGDPLTPHEWLSDVIFTLAYRLGGFNGVVWLTALVIALSVWLIYSASLRYSRMSLMAVFFAVLAAAASSLHWLTRPHVFTILLTIIWADNLEKLRQRKKQSWYIFPVIMLIWVNLHGAFFAGLLIWLCYFAGSLLENPRSWEEMRPIIWAGLSSFLVTLLNPAGFGVWKTGIGFLGNQYLVGHTAEYLPPDFQDISTWPFMLLILISLIVLMISRRKVQIYQLLIIGGWSILALYSARNIPLYAAAAVPFICIISANVVRDNLDIRPIRWLNNFQDRFQSINGLLRGGIWAAIVLVAVGGLFASGIRLDFEQQGNDFLPEIFPVEAASWLEGQSHSGKGFNYFPWGGYLLYRLWPANLVFIDGQTDFYGEDLTRQYERVITLGEGWQEILNYYQIEWVLMPAESELIQELDASEDWEIIYFDQTAALAVSRDDH
jgi:hypothetical protein